MRIFNLTIIKICLMRNFLIFFSTTFLIVLNLSIFGQNNSSQNTQRDNPSVIIHDTVTAPGELLLQVEALNFTGDNGLVSAITLRIEIDTLLIDFIYIQNTSLSGGWLANYNIFFNEITITYTAPFGTGYDIDGKLLDLHLEYFGGFPADLHFKSGCEISNVNLQTITDIVYVDGTINQSETVGNIKQDSVVAYYDQIFQMPVMAVGAGYDLVTNINLRLGYDTSQIEYLGFVGSALSDITVVNDDAMITIDWEDTISPQNFVSLDTLLYLNFLFIGDSITFTEFLPGSRVFNNRILVASEFVHGQINPKLLVEVINSPDTAGYALGGGYYFPGETVSLTAIPEPGFHFLNWSQNENILTTDSIYTFVKLNSNDTLTAKYQANTYNLSLFASPEEGGEVFTSGEYSYGEIVTVTAVPDEAYYFLYWVEGSDTVSYDEEYIFTMPNNDLSLTAYFEPYVFVITATPNDETFGTTEGDGEFFYGEDVTVIATPFEDYEFIVWTEFDQPVSYDSMYSFNAYSDRDLIAHFQYSSECLAPIGLYVNSLSETTALLNWLPSGFEDEWDVLWGEANFDTINEGELITELSETQYLLENLDPGTVYDFYVRAICTEELHSSWAGPVKFTTWFVGIENFEKKTVINIYPNPTTNIINVVFNEKVDGIKNFRIINTFGVVQKEGKTNAEEMFTISLDDLSPGAHILHLLVGNNRYTKIFVKQ